MEDQTFSIFNKLVHGWDTENILSSLNDPNKLKIDRQQLRLLIKDAIINKYPPSKLEGMDDKSPWSRVRSRLIDALGRISDDDPEIVSFIKEYLNPRYERNRWVRYYALVGLVNSNYPDIVKEAHRVWDGDRNDWPKMLAGAILASDGNIEVLKSFLSEVENGRIAALRALRNVPIQEAIPILMDIVNSRPKNEDTVYDAIRALGSMPKDWYQVNDISEMLQTFLKELRKDWWLIELRSRTIESIGKLGVQTSVPLLIEELSDENPSIIFEASRAIQRILGTRRAVSRLVETATLGDKEYIEPYANSLRWMDRDQVVEELESLMISGLPDQQETSRKLLIEIGGLAAFQKIRSKADSISQYNKVLENAEKNIRDLFNSSISEAQRGFKLALFMDITIFLFGLILAGTSAWIAISKEGNLTNWVGVSVTGGAGVLGVIYGTLIKNPRKQIKEAVDHLMFLKVIFLGYLRQLHQIDQSFTRQLLEREEIEQEDLNNFTEMIGNTMKIAIEKMAGQS